MNFYDFCNFDLKFSHSNLSKNQDEKSGDGDSFTKSSIQILEIQPNKPKEKDYYKLQARCSFFGNLITIEFSFGASFATFLLFEYDIEWEKVNDILPTIVPKKNKNHQVE